MHGSQFTYKSEQSFVEVALSVPKCCWPSPSSLANLPKAQHELAQRRKKSRSGMGKLCVASVGWAGLA